MWGVVETQHALDFWWSMVFAENRLPPIWSSPRACFSGSRPRLPRGQISRPVGRTPIAIAGIAAGTAGSVVAVGDTALRFAAEQNDKIGPSPGFRAHALV